MLRLLSSACVALCLFAGAAVAGPAETLAATFKVCVEEAPNMRKATARMDALGWKTLDRQGQFEFFFADNRKSFLMINGGANRGAGCSLGIKDMRADGAMQMAAALVANTFGKRAQRLDPEAAELPPGTLAAWLAKDAKGRPFVVLVNRQLNAGSLYRGSLITVVLDR